MQKIGYKKEATRELRYSRMFDAQSCYYLKSINRHKNQREIKEEKGTLHYVIHRCMRVIPENCPI